MLDEYTLYLDESESDDNFSIAGVIIKNDEFPILETSISEVKEMIWDSEFIKRENPTLHSTELSIIYNNRKNPKKCRYTNGSYTVFNNKTDVEISDIYNKVYVKLTCIIKEQNITTIGCIINKRKFEEFYIINGKMDMIDNWYDIAMQEIIEMYSHFLCSVNGIGSIACEARSAVGDNKKNAADVKMYNNFCKIKVNNKGISYIKCDTLDDRIRNLDIIGKKENNAGLQLADLVAFNFVKWSNSRDNNKTDFMKRIHRAAYNAGYDVTLKDMRSYWGIRMIPFDFTYIDSLINERKTIKRAYENLKRDRNNIAKKSKILKEEKQKLKDELKVLKDENIRLKEELNAKNI